VDKKRHAAIVYGWLFELEKWIELGERKIIVCAK
jgi:hypothetical protein